MSYRHVSGYDFSTLNATTHSVDGGITPGGVVTFQLGQSVSGGITPTGDLSNIISTGDLLVSGGITPVGDVPVLGIGNDVMIGVITPSGTVDSIIVQFATDGIEGGINPSGSLNLSPGITPSGGITPVGTLILPTEFQTISGSIAPSGDVVNSIVYLGAGSVSGGSIRRRRR